MFSLERFLLNVITIILVLSFAGFIIMLFSKEYINASIFLLFTIYLKFIKIEMVKQINNKE